MTLYEKWNQKQSELLAGCAQHIKSEENKEYSESWCILNEYISSNLPRKCVRVFVGTVAWVDEAKSESRLAK